MTREEHPFNEIIPTGKKGIMLYKLIFNLKTFAQSKYLKLALNKICQLKLMFWTWNWNI